MTFKIRRNILIEGKHNKPILLDSYCSKNTKPLPTVIYCHGFKGFKDWGANELMAHSFAERGINFIKFNFSYNGGTVEQPVDFPDLEAFGNNNFTKELDDLESVLSWVQSKVFPGSSPRDLILMGHSRGSGIAIIKAAENSAVKKIISLAGVSDYESRFNHREALEEWRKKRVLYIENSRTKQQMPLYYQLYEDLEKNKDRLNIKNAAQQLEIPHLIIHGTNDQTVLPEEAERLNMWSKHSCLKIIAAADHVFNIKHPWKEKTVSDNFQQVIDYSIDFIMEN